MVEIVLDGPGRNALGTAMMEGLVARVEAARGEPILLGGAGGVFSSGLNLKEIASFDAAGMEAYVRLLHRMAVTLFEHPAPTVARLDGHAIAGGCVVAMCCDLVVCTDDPRARIGLNEVALGLRFPPAVLGILLHRLDPRWRAAVLLGGDLFDPGGAHRAGIVDEVVPAADLAARALARLAALAAHPRRAYAAMKADLQAGAARADAEAERRFVAEVLPLWTAPETKERALAALRR